MLYPVLMKEFLGLRTRSDLQRFSGVDLAENDPVWHKPRVVVVKVVISFVDLSWHTFTVNRTALQTFF